MDIIHANLHVADVERSIEFYTDQLGFERTWGFDSPDGDAKHRYVAADNGVEVQLTETEGEIDLDHGDAYDHLALGVDDVDAAFEEIDHHGVVKEPGDQPEAGARTAFVRDPDGYKVELVEPLED